MRVGIALGSNFDDRLENLRAARRHLFALHEDRGPFLCSRIYETDPVVEVRAERDADPHFKPSTSCMS